MTIPPNVKVGFLFAMLTAILWGTVPIAVQQVVNVMTPVTLVWYRFVGAFILLSLILLSKKSLPSIAIALKPVIVVLFLFAVLGLVGNFIFYSYSLQSLSATSVQLLIQFSVVILMLASICIFKDRLTKGQLFGMLVLIVGLLLFFNDSLHELLTKFSEHTQGVVFGLVAAIAWAVYGIGQKVLLRYLAAQQILWIVYGACGLLLFIWAQPSEFYNLSYLQQGCLIYCIFNTVIAYGAMAEAMARWQVSQVTAVVALSPLYVLIFSDGLALFWPLYFGFEKLNFLSYLGAVVVVLGAMLVVAGHLVKFNFIKSTIK